MNSEQITVFLQEHWYIASVLIGAVILIGATRNWNWLCDPTGTRDAHRHSRGYRRVVFFLLGVLLIVKEWAEKRLPTVILCSTTGNELLEVWYYGDLLTVKGEPQSYIIDSDEAPGLVTARDPESGEEFVIFDGGRHGYDNMFCDEHDPSELEHRPLKRYEIPASKLVLELGYSIDYEDEKENFEPDEADTVELINGERMPWEQAKRDGIDYIALYYVNEKGKPVQILDAELA